MELEDSDGTAKSRPWITTPLPKALVDHPTLGSTIQVARDTSNHRGKRFYILPRNLPWPPGFKRPVIKLWLGGTECHPLCTVFFHRSRISAGAVGWEREQCSTFSGTAPKLNPTGRRWHAGSGIWPMLLLRGILGHACCTSLDDYPATECSQGMHTLVLEIGDPTNEIPVVCQGQWVAWHGRSVR